MENFLAEYSKLLDESGEHLSFQTIATYLNLKEKLSSKEKKFVEEHLKVCGSCSEKYKTVLEEDQELDAITKSAGIAKPGEGEIKIFRKAGYWKYAAAAIILIGIIAILYFSYNPDREQLLTEKNTIQKKYQEDNKTLTDSSSHQEKPGPEKKIEEKDIISPPDNETFAANNILENFVNRDIRSNQTIRIISPEIGDTVSSTIVFEWRRIGPTGELSLIVVDNKNKPVYQMSVAGSTLIIDRKLKAGLYYWKLEAEGKLESLGKFFISK